MNRRIRLGDWLDELEAFMDGGDLEMVGRATGMLNSLPKRDREELVALLEEARTLEIEYPQLRNFVMQALCEKIALVDLDLAFGTALDLDLNQFGGKSYIAGVVLGSHVDVDPAAAVDAYFEADAAGTIGAPAGEGFASRLFRNPVLTTFFVRLYDIERAEAERLFDGLGTHDRRVALMSQKELYGDRDKRAPLIELALRAPDEAGRLDGLEAIAESYGATSGYGAGSLSLVGDLTERGELSPAVGAGLLVSAVKHFLHPYQKPDEAIAWLGKNTPPDFVEANLARAGKLRDAFAAK